MKYLKLQENKDFQEDSPKATKLHDKNRRVGNTEQGAEELAASAAAACTWGLEFREINPSWETHAFYISCEWFGLIRDIDIPKKTANVQKAS